MHGLGYEHYRRLCCWPYLLGVPQIRVCGASEVRHRTSMLDSASAPDLDPALVETGL